MSLFVFANSVSKKCFDLLNIFEKNIVYLNGTLETLTEAPVTSNVVGWWNRHAGVCVSAANVYAFTASAAEYRVNESVLKLILIYRLTDII